MTLQNIFTSAPALRQVASSYLRAAPLPHVFSGLCLAAIVCLAVFAQTAPKGYGSAETFVFEWLGLFFSLSVLLCSSADAHCRFREYRRFKRLFLRFGFRPRILRLSGGSRCQRDAMLQAARETGLQQLVQAEFARQGYRWYHFIPDQIANNPFFVFHPRFLRSTFWPG